LTRLGSGKGAKYRFEADPIVIDGVMYIPTGNDDIYALDANTGQEVWRFYTSPARATSAATPGRTTVAFPFGTAVALSGRRRPSIPTSG